jgi:hypothetical protein
MGVPRLGTLQSEAGLSRSWEPAFLMLQRHVAIKGGLDELRMGILDNDSLDRAKTIVSTYRLQI